MKIADDFTLMVTRADAPYETCADVVEAAKSERVVAGISGATGLDNVVFTLTEQQTDVEFDRVSFESGGELTAALLGEQIDIASLNPGEVIGQLESGDIKALCAYADERYDYEELKDIPTASEQGIDVAFAQFRGVLAPGDISDSATRLLGRADGGGHRDRRVRHLHRGQLPPAQHRRRRRLLRLPRGEQRRS